MEVQASSNSQSGQTWIEVTFLVLYSVFVIFNILSITKFANRRELLSTFIMLTSLAALLCKVYTLFYFSSASDDSLPGFGSQSRQTTGVLLFQLRDPLPHIQSSCVLNPIAVVSLIAPTTKFYRM